MQSANKMYIHVGSTTSVSNTFYNLTKKCFQYFGIFTREDNIVSFPLFPRDKWFVKPDFTSLLLILALHKGRTFSAPAKLFAISKLEYK